jgi:hypothetical protein
MVRLFYSQKCQKLKSPKKSLCYNNTVVQIIHEYINHNILSVNAHENIKQTENKNLQLHILKSKPIPVRKEQMHKITNIYYYH